MSFIGDLFMNIRIKDIIDIFIVALMFYKLFSLIKETRAEQLLKGIFALFIFAKLSGVLKLYTINWILENAMTVGVIAILIVFQPELRKGLEYIGRSRLLTKSLLEFRGENHWRKVEEIINATASLSRQKIGALMVLERQIGLNDIVETGTEINGYVSSDLLINIFIPNTPLHDGAVIIKGDIIKAAACFLPLTENINLSSELGTRHRAAIGISEKSDTLSIVVSEETGAISIAENGEISKHIDIQTLEQILLDMYKPKDEDERFINRWRRRDEEQREEE